MTRDDSPPPGIAAGRYFRTTHWSLVMAARHAALDPVVRRARLTSIRFLPPEFEAYEDIVRGIKVEWFVFSTTPGAATIERRSLARAQLQLHTPGALVTVTGRLTGPNGEQASFRKSVRIVNTPPQITAFRVNQIPNGIVQASVSVVDPGNPGDVLVKIDWGDGTSTLGTPPAGGTFGAQHQYRDSDANRPLFNEYTLIATVTDPEGEIDSRCGGWIATSRSGTRVGR